MHILATAEAQNRHVEDLLADVLKKHPDLPKNERAFMLELVQGVKRWELRLDYLLSRLSRLAWPKVHPLVRHILRLGAYQILFLDKIPAHAAVDEAARLARRRRLPASHVGFINAILRRLAAGEVPSLPEITEDPVAALACSNRTPGLARGPLAVPLRNRGNPGPPRGQQRGAASHRASEYPQD